MILVPGRQLLMRSLRSRLSILAMLAALATVLPLESAQAQRSERQRRDATKAARAHYQRGRAHHERHEYQQAVREYLLAHEQEPSPALLFNIAQAYLLSGEREQALAYYRAYLREEPKGDVSDLARNRVEAIEGELAAESLQPQPSGDDRAGDSDEATEPHAGVGAPPLQADQEPSPASDDAGSPGRGLRLTGLVVAGVGLVGLGVGVTFGLDARDVQNRIDSQPEGTPWMFDDLYAEGEVASRNMWISYGVGGAALIAGGALYFLGRSRGNTRERQVAIVPVWDRSGSGLVLVGGF